ncbi:hypothetical protein EYB25_008274 [Talaromyces marneffei]|nr:hypothetical protein EYB25_008274 [Talaromyces marneffei]
MTRLPGRLVPGRAQNSSARSKFRKHKVILESVTQKRKRLRTILSFEAKAPPGYTFIPAGNPTFTTACKEFCREQSLKIFTVTTTPHQNTHGLSQQVHRVGYHFPSTVVAQKCMELGLYISENGNVVPFEQFGTKPATTDGDVDVPQITINTEARDVIRDLFPRIPDDDINQIIKTAFQKGQRKVGTAVELPLARRAQLAVVAHIRHLYTDYDKLLKTTSFQEARRSVEDSTLEKLVQWRGDDESGMPELEDVFREVIVISDDEEGDAEESDFIENENVASTDQGLSVEVLSSQVAADKVDVITNDDSNHIVSPFPIRVGRKPLFSDYNYGAGTTIQASSKARVDRRGFSRYRAWDRAMDRYREKALSGYNEPSSSRAPVVTRDEAFVISRPSYGHGNQAIGRALTPIVERVFDPLFKGVAYDNRPHSSDVLHHGREYASQDGNRVQAGPPSEHKTPDILRFSDGSVFSKIPPVSSHKRNSFPIDVSSAPVFVAGPRLFSEGNNETTLKRVHPTAHRPPSRNRSGDSPRNHTIIPSIERRDSPISTGFPLQHKTSDPNILPNVVRGTSASQYRRPLDELSKRIDLIDLTEDQEFPKRRRLESQEILSDPHRSSSYRDDLMSFEVVESRTQPGHLMKHKRYFESVSQGKRPDIAPVMRTDPAPYMMNRPREETTDRAAYYPNNMLHGSSTSVSRVVLGSSEAFNGSGSTPTGRPRVDTLPQYRNSNSSGDSYVVEPPKEAPPRMDYPASSHHSHHSRGTGSDDAVWRSKANSYGSHRRLLAAQDPTWLTGSTNVPQLSLPMSRAHRLERVTHSPVHNQEDFMEQSVDLTRDATPDNASQYYGTQNRRISSQPLVFDSQRKRDALPASAVRRYEVQLEKSLNPHRYGSAPFQERQ